MIVCFFFNDTATTEIYTLALHDALPISGAPAALRTSGRSRAGLPPAERGGSLDRTGRHPDVDPAGDPVRRLGRSEEHTSELQSRQYLVCRLLLEKKKIYNNSDSTL